MIAAVDVNATHPSHEIQLAGRCGGWRYRRLSSASVAAPRFDEACAVIWRGWTLGSQVVQDGAVGMVITRAHVDQLLQCRLHLHNFPQLFLQIRQMAFGNGLDLPAAALGVTLFADQLSDLRHRKPQTA